jgi:hypothetical protein
LRSNLCLNGQIDQRLGTPTVVTHTHTHTHLPEHRQRPPVSDHVQSGQSAAGNSKRYTGHNHQSRGQHVAHSHTHKVRNAVCGENEQPTSKWV